MKHPDPVLAAKAVRCWGDFGAVDRARPAIDVLSLRLQQYSRGARDESQLADSIAAVLLALAQVELLASPIEIELAMLQQEKAIALELEVCFGKEA